jgi:peroxiredoxin
MSRTATALAVALSLAATASAGEFNPVLSVGDAAPAWVDLPGTDGQTHSLADLKDRPVVVLVFNCNSCPVAVDYEDRIIGLAKKYAGPDGQVALVAVNVNTIEADRLPKMTERAREKGFPFPYLYDGSQKLAKLYGASYTPEFFVLDAGRKVVYMGAMDDKSQPGAATVNYLERAVEAALKGEKPAVAETLARGCRIRFERRR